MKVIIPTAFRRHTGGAKQVIVEVPAGSESLNVGDALRQVVVAHPDLKTSLYDSDDQLVSFVNVFVNDKNIRDLENDATVLSDQDEILLVPAIAGG